jgi:hypothetical protein
MRPSRITSVSTALGTPARARDAAATGEDMV